MEVLHELDHMAVTIVDNGMMVLCAANGYAELML